jgi:S-DNA-T family DNA segregation ATPase FtsK/SpoIIIE
VLGAESKLRTQTVLRRLAELNPDAYAEWTFRDLAAALADAEIRPVKIRGNMFVRAADVTDTLTERDTEDDE